MGVNKVEYYGRTLMDTTETTVSEDTLMEGKTAINAAGEQITGNLRAVEYKAQNPTAEEKAQARENIDALGTDDLPEAINTALTQAKESGEFDGKDGQDGQDGHDGSDGIGIMTIEQVTVSSEDGAKNVWRMTLTNGQTADFVVENGAKGTDGKDGKSAYEVAQEAGFTGTEEEFGDMLNKCISGVHKHRWDQITDRPFGDFPTEEGIDTVTSDDVVYGKLHRVSEFIPTYEDLQQGGTITYYRVSGGAITGGLQTITFPQGDYTIRDTNNGIMINSDGVPMVIISYNGKPQFGAITISDITEPGVYFDQGDYGKCIHSLKINGYDGFKLYEARPIPKKYLPDDIGAVKTVNYISPDANGNINIEVGEGGGGSGKADSAFDLLRSDTLTWNGDEEGRAIVKDDGENIYAHVSSVVPTATDLQNGGSCRYIDTDEVYTFDSIKTETNDYIVVDQYNSIVIAKKDNVAFDGLTLPKKGIYLYYFNNQDYASHFTINGYTGFSEPILKIENLTPHGHDWYGKAINKGNTARSDDIIHGGFVKVSDAVPTLAEVQKGGMLRFYNVENGVITGDVIIANYLESPYGVYSANGQILIASDGITMVQIKADGVYFRQDQYDCVHSLTINGYEGFSYNLEKIPAELIPEGVGGGVSSWNDLTDKPFGETVVTKDAITWDGNTDGLADVMGMFFNVSNAIPTLEDLQQGGSLTFGGNEITFTSSNVIDVESVGMGSGVIIINAANNYVIGVALRAGATGVFNGATLTFEKAGIYFLNNAQYSVYVSRLAINNYTFAETEITQIDQKYLPSAPNSADIVFTASNSPFEGGAVSCNKTFEALWAMSIGKLLGAITIQNTDEASGAWKVSAVERGVMTDRNIIMFTFGGLNPGSGWDYYIIVMNSLGEIAFMS